jgi:hypothetical protein
MIFPEPHGPLPIDEDSRQTSPAQARQTGRRHQIILYADIIQVIER